MLLMAVFYIAIQIYINIFLGWHANQYAELSKSFLQGRLDFSKEYVQQVGAWDMVYSNGKYYWPLGPFPAIALMPVVALDEVIPLRSSQSVINILFALIATFATYRIARKVGYTEKDSFFWTIGVMLGSTLIGVITFSSSWYLAHTVSVALVLLSLHEYLHRSRPLIIGLLMTAVVATRPTAGLGIIFFGMAFLFGSEVWQEKLRRLCVLSLPFCIGVALLLCYNVVRFDSFTNTGYQKQLIPEAAVIENRDTSGLFSLQHVPRNIFFMIWGTPRLLTLPPTPTEKSITIPVFDPRGMSIILMTPWLLWVFFVVFNKKIQWLLLGTTGLIASVILLWHSTGCVQLGYRLALDFLPYLMIALILAYYQKRATLSVSFKTIIVLATIINVCLVLTSIFVIPNNSVCSL